MIYFAILPTTCYTSEPLRRLLSVFAKTVKFKMGFVFRLLIFPHFCFYLRKRIYSVSVLHFQFHFKNLIFSVIDLGNNQLFSYSTSSSKPFSHYIQYSIILCIILYYATRTGSRRGRSSLIT